MQDVERIVVTYGARGFVDRYAYVADFAEIKENDFNLNIPRYVDTFEPEPDVDMEAMAAEIVKLDIQLSEVQQSMRQYLDELGFAE
jgi:type I restriction enzyme M protein